MVSFHRGNTTLMNVFRTFSRVLTNIFSQVLGTPSTICVITILISALLSGNQSVLSPLGGAIGFYLLLPLVSWSHSAMTGQRMLSGLHDSNQEQLDYRQSLLLPFLPEKDHVSADEWNKISDKLKLIQGRRHDNQKVEPSSGWALVTGASSGIGRAIAIELARYNVPVILVARDIARLTEVSNQIEEYYGVATKIIASDFTAGDASEKLYEATSKNGHEVDILVHNAGIAETADFTDTELVSIENMILVNALTGTKLLRLYGKDMKDRRRGRLVVMSSITGAVAGVPTTSVYAATKAYQKSLAASIGLELEPFGVGVTLVIPGAVSNTAFAKKSNMDDAVIWKLPFGILTPEIVAATTIRSMIIGNHEVVVGWLNVIFWIAKDLLPARIILLTTKFTWMPISFPCFRKEKASDDEAGLSEL